MQSIERTGVSETQLVALAGKGDMDAFNELVLRYQGLVYSLTRSILGDPDRAEDAVQQTFISAFQHLGGFRGGSFRSWLLRTASNTCYDFLRSLKRHPTVPLIPQDANGGEIECPVWMADPSPSAQAQMESNELAQTLYRRLDELPGVYRSVITLVDLNGIDYDEAARALNIPLGTVKSRLARARLQMRERLSQDPGFSTGQDLSGMPAWG